MPMTNGNLPPPIGAEMAENYVAIPAPIERIYDADASPIVDPEAVERLCQVWAEVGRAILLRRSQQK